MISFISKKINRLNQEKYNDYIASIDFSTCSCNCGATGRFNMHGYYTRTIKNPSRKIKLNILRVKCKSCGRTHAVLYPSIVPYSQVVLIDTLDIVSNYLNNESNNSVLNLNPEITESDVRYTIKKFKKHWKERIKSLTIYPMVDFFKLNNFLELVSKAFKIAFMQIKSTFYSLI